MGSGLEYGPRRMQGRMQGQARNWQLQGRVGLYGACRGAGSEPGRAARKTRGRALRNRPQINYRSVARRGMQLRG